MGQVVYSETSFSADSYIQNSGSTGSYDTTSASWTSVTKASVTLTTHGRPVLLSLQGTNEDETKGYFAGNSHTSKFGIFRDSVAVHYFCASSDVNYIPKSNIIVIDYVPDAGSHTWELKVRSDGVYHIFVYDMKLVAVEL